MNPIYVFSMQRLESNANAQLSWHFEDRRYVEELEKELRNCSQEIGSEHRTFGAKIAYGQACYMHRIRSCDLS